MIHIFYHSADLDGKCSGAIAHRKFPNAKLHPINYGDSFPWLEIGSNDTVYMLDFTLQPASEMVQLDSLCDLIVIDHHGSAISAFKELEYSPPGVMRTDYAACQLTWTYLNESPIPQAVDLIGKWDIWDHDIEEVTPFQYGMRALPNDPEQPIWDNLLNPDTKFNDTTMMNTILRNGYVVMSYEQVNNFSKMSGLVYEKAVMIKGNRYRAVIANMPFGGSKCFDGYFDPEHHDLMITFFRHPQGIWSIGLYSEEGGINVADICKSMGGGGHPNAGGFQLLSIDWLLS